MEYIEAFPCFTVCKVVCVCHLFATEVVVSAKAWFTSAYSDFLVGEFVVHNFVFT